MEIVSLAAARDRLAGQRPFTSPQRPSGSPNAQPGVVLQFSGQATSQAAPPSIDHDEAENLVAAVAQTDPAALGAVHELDWQRVLHLIG